MSESPTTSYRTDAGPKGANDDKTDAADLGWLGMLNRHWYRRCLDALEANLKKSGGSPTVEELKDLCDRIVTGFLTAVTAQAPDSPRLQFPADRAYFIPFHGDNAERFNFAKPFYQFLGTPTTEQKDNDYGNSLWSFFPWHQMPDRVRIDPTSIDKQQRDLTISFDRMVQVGELFTDKDQATDKDESDQVTKKEENELRVKKALLLRGWDKDERQHLPLTDESKKEIREKNAEALEAIFEIYRVTPGNAAVEFLLLNHLHIIQWLNQLQGRESGKGEVTLLQTEDDYKKLYNVFLRWYFLKKIAEGCDEQEIKRQDTLLENLREFMTDPAWDEESAAKAWAETPAGKELVEALAMSADAPFLKALEYDMGEAGPKAGADAAKPATNPQGGQSAPAQEQKIAPRLRSLRPFLRSFESDFLTPSREEELEAELAQSLGDKLLRAGETKQSFVWVCPDFEDVDQGLYPQRRLKSESKKERVKHLSKQLAAPWVKFFRHCDQLYLENMGDSLKAYWRTLEEVDRESYIFSSYDDARTKQGIPKMMPNLTPQGTNGEVRERFLPAHKLKDPRPQNIFLRVKICDSLNEPIINGLFVFTTDHDEVIFKGKAEGVRNDEDINDLLAFAKVYFFIVRDYLAGLDRARDARDIGRLNQQLYDERLRDLEKRMTEREKKDDDFKKRGVIDKANWSKFVYELLNNYALSLVEKPKDVRIETFSYDRLLIIPLATEGVSSDAAAQAAGEKNLYDLPFYLFQSIYVERDQGQISGTHYSLVKPTQSPIEAIDADSATHRFRARSFQQVSSSKDARDKLEKILEKHYVGAIDYPPVEPEDTQKPVKAASTKDSLPICSFVPKALEPNQSVLAQDKPKDWGRQWAKAALTVFWNKMTTSGQAELDRELITKLWNPFLTSLTATYRDLLTSDAATKLDSKSRQFFCLRLAILRTILNHVDMKCPAAEEIKFQYRKILRLQFDDNQKWNVLDLAQKKVRPLFEDLGKLLRQKDNDLVDFHFVDISLGKADEFIVEFLGTLTSYLVHGKPDDKGAKPDDKGKKPDDKGKKPDDKGARPDGDSSTAATGKDATWFQKRCQPADKSPTWFQPVLTRPLADPNLLFAYYAKGRSFFLISERRAQRDALTQFAKEKGIANEQITRGDFLEFFQSASAQADGKIPDQELTPAHAIGERLPIRSIPDDRVKQIFPDLKADPTGATVFLGTINLQLGSNERDMRRLSYLIAMIRDFDRTEWGTGMTKEEIQEDIENDLSDLRLFTRTFFQNAYNFIAESVNRQQIRVLSTDVNQIARNWYSSGIDDIVRSLHEGLSRLLQRPDGNLGRLRPEMMDCLFDSLLNVLVKEQSRPGNIENTIDLESFPFDRLVHVPLILGSEDAPRLMYGRTTIEKKKDTRGEAWSQKTGADTYKVIRDRGRTWDASGGRKTIKPLHDGEAIVHLGQKPDPTKKSDDRLAARETELHKALARLANELPLRDAFIRGLYEGEPLQSLALAGLIYHLLQRFRHNLDLTVPQCKELAEKFQQLADSLTPVMRNSFDVLERTTVGNASVQTRVHMQRLVVLEPRSTFRSRNADGQAQLPVFRELFEALEGDYQYGLGAAEAPKESKVFFVYYSLAEPEGFTEVLEGSARYRGVFCFILDDATTDVKADDANAADQEDIRTLVHNCVGNFKQVLEQQALHHQLTQRGVEQMILGMLHRLKTDVVITSKVLGGIDEVLGKPEKLADGELRKQAFAKLQEKTLSGKLAMDGTEKLFKDLKKLSEFKNPPIQTFSSMWLAEFFVAKLAEAIAGALRASGQSEQAEEIPKIVERFKHQVEKACKGTNVSSSGRSDEARRRLAREAQNKAVADICQRHLLQLQKHLETVCAAGGREVELSFSYHVFSPELIEFRGSFLLEEALAILLENAFQAMMGFLHQAGTDKPDAPGAGRLGLVCRPGENGNVFLEITNSSFPVDDNLEKTLKAKPPEPISARQHATGSGKKGGSGVGHYFAREVIRRHCGGQQVRQELDVDFEQDKDHQTVKVTVKLLRAVNRPKQRVTTTQLRDAITGAARFVLDKALAMPADFADAVQRDFPGDFEPADLFRIIWQLLDYDRQKLEERLADLAKGPCGRIAYKTVGLQADLVQALREIENSNDRPDDLRKQANGFRLELESPVDNRKGSWFDLERILRARQKSPVLELLPNRKGLEILQGFAQGEALDPLKFVPDDPDSKFAEGFREVACFLDCKNAKDLLKDLEVEVDGKPKPSPKQLYKVSRQPFWDFKSIPSGSGLLLAFRLYYGDPAGKVLSWEPTGKRPFPDDKDKEFAENFNKDHVGRIFLQYRAALRREQIGELWFESNTPGAPAECAFRTVYLRLDLPTGGS